MNQAQDIPKVWIKEMPWIEIVPYRHSPTPDAAVIQRLIEQLARPDIPRKKLLSCLSVGDFLPAGWRPEPTYYASRIESRDAEPVAEFRRLIEIGPQAIPILLQNLDNTTETSLTISPALREIGFSFQLSYDGNPANPAERSALKRLHLKKYSETGLRDKDHYSVCLGDLCYAALGQIVSRYYIPVRNVPTAITQVSSPARNPALREAIRSLWNGGSTPRQILLQSLLRDFATRGDYDADAEAGWSLASDLQTAASLRLLYYFPDECAGFIARRLESLDVRAIDLPDEGEVPKRLLRALRAQAIANGIRVPDFIQAVRWSKHPAIRGALAKLARRTDDPAIRRLIATS